MDLSRSEEKNFNYNIKGGSEDHELEIRQTVKDIPKTIDNKTRTRAEVMSKSLNTA